MFKISPLPYNYQDLAPYISAQTMELHYSKHHQAYVDNLNKLVLGTDMETMSLEELLLKINNQPEKTAIFNNAGQHYNHEIFWLSLSPVASKKEMPSALKIMIERDFESVDNLLARFKEEAAAQFGSGWVWLVLKNDKLMVTKTANGRPAFLDGAKPLLALDVWEHSYYLDYQNKRLDFVEAVFKNLFNWNFAAKQAGL
ncbi:MAG: superoxide dismutase [Patescibacteria group bacterium]|jgi:Fe-Mn family superoxide dismutase|nr:superoxide dismutase [Patescibacteria group bacterium]